ncbi:MAG: hypothetical protein AAFR65_12300 [Pseudomonadota bacterium]
MTAINSDDMLKKELRTLFIRIAVLLAGGVILGLIVSLLGASHIGTLIVGLSFVVSVVLMVLLMARFVKKRADATAEKPANS